MRNTTLVKILFLTGVVATGINLQDPEIVSPLPDHIVIVAAEITPYPRGGEERVAPEAQTTGPTLTAVNNRVDAAKLRAVQESNYPAFLNHIWTNESTQGTNPKPGSLQAHCESRGMTNEFGFYPQGKWCWSTFEEGVERIELWREREAAGLTDNQALCYYNGAGKVNDCPYLHIHDLARAF